MFSISRGLLVWIVTSTIQLSTSGVLEWPCDHPILCNLDTTGLLHTVQMANVLKDSKTFVDMPLNHSIKETIARFEALGAGPSRAAVERFLMDNFAAVGSDLVKSNLSDWEDDPFVINKIQDKSYRQFASELHKRWRNLTFSVSASISPERTTLIPLREPFVVPGARYREMHYWDSYWTIKGLLVSELQDTVKGMLDNFKDLVDLYGYIPSGARRYYEGRSHAPLYTQMVQLFIKDLSSDVPSQERMMYATYILSMDTEFQYWYSRFTWNITKDGGEYRLASYSINSEGPRPEAYREDYTLAQFLPSDKRRDWYGHMKSAAESGWGSSSRWFSEPVNIEHPLLSVATGDFIPVDLNSILYKNARIIAGYYEVLERKEDAMKYNLIAEKLKDAIRAVLWNEENSMWYDFNIKTNKQNRQFYPSNLSPLYFGAYHTSINRSRVLESIVKTGATNYSGGVPASLFNSTPAGQLWDYPHVLPPLVEMFVVSLGELNLTESRNLAKETAHKFVHNVYVSSLQNGSVYEIYNCESNGISIGDREFNVQFGWTNGVVLSLLDQYPDLRSSARRRSSVPLSSWMLTLVFLLLSNYFLKG